MPVHPTPADDPSIAALHTLYAANRPVLFTRVQEMIEEGRDGWSEALVAIADRITLDPNDQAADVERHRHLAAWNGHPQACLVFLAVELMEASLVSLRAFAHQLRHNGSNRAVVAVTLAQLSDDGSDHLYAALTEAVRRLDTDDACDLVTVCAGCVLALGVSAPDLLSLAPQGA